MDRLLDQPITDQEADQLGFQTLAHMIVSSIEAQPNAASLTLGLDGPWGSGKSSILHLIQASLKAAPGSDSIGTVVVPFSPWLVTNRTALIASFFGQLSKAISQAERRIPRNLLLFKKQARRTLSTARKELNKFARVASIVSTATSVLDPTMISAAAAGGSRALEGLTNDTGEDTLETLKQQLAAALSNIAKADPSFRILVLIDDLDRLDPNDALEVLRLVKAVGDFPATTYLLAYDRSAIGTAIEQSAKVKDGSAYLEKIIQFSFNVPPLEPFQLRNWLRRELNDLFPGDLNAAAQHASAVLDAWAGRLLQTPRDVKRLLFAIRALWPTLAGRIDLLDLIWLEMIAQKASDKDRNLYAWVVAYLQGLEAIAIGGMVTGTEESRTELVNILKAIGWKEYVHEGQGSMDFHHLDELLAGITASYLSSDDQAWTHKASEDDLQAYRDGRRLSSPWHWRLYFALDHPSHAVTDDEWLALLAAADSSTEDLSETLAKMLDVRGAQRPDASDQIVNRALHMLSGDRLTHPDRWLVAFVENGPAMRGRSKVGGLGFHRLYEFNIHDFSRKVFRTVSRETRKELIERIFGDVRNLFPAADLVRDQFHWSKKQGYERDEMLALAEDELARAVMLQLALYEKLTPVELWALPDPYEVLFAWRDLSESSDGPVGLIESACADDAGFLDTLTALRKVTSSAQGGVPHLPENWLKDLLDLDAAKERLKRLARGEGTEALRAAELNQLWYGEW